MNLILVVLIFGTLSGILTNFLTEPPLGYHLSWIVGALLLIVAASSYTLVLIPQVVEAAIYTNILLDEKSHRVYESRYAPPASQIAALLFKALLQDDKDLAGELLHSLGLLDDRILALDLLEYLLFYALSGFDPFWASPRVQFFGRPSWSGQPLGEKFTYKPSSILRMIGKKDDRDTDTGVKIVGIADQFESNRIVGHFFRGATKLDSVFQPTNWMMWVPKRVKLAITRDTGRRIMLRDPYAQLTVTLSRAGTGIGLPYGIRNKETGYDEYGFSTSDFRLDFRFELRTIGRILSFLPMIDSYMNWSDKIKRKLVSAFALEEVALSA